MMRNIFFACFAVIMAALAISARSPEEAFFMGILAILNIGVILIDRN